MKPLLIAAAVLAIFVAPASAQILPNPATLNTQALLADTNSHMQAA